MPKSVFKRKFNHWSNHLPKERSNLSEGKPKPKFNLTLNLGSNPNFKARPKAPFQELTFEKKRPVDNWVSLNILNP